MRRILQSIVLSLLLISTLFTVSVPISQVSAQRFNTTTTTSHNFQELITADRLQNDTFIAAYEEYKQAVDQFALHDIYDDSTAGSTVSDVQEGFESSVNGSYHTLTDSEAYLSYLYTVEDVNYAEILFYYVNDELYYIGLTNLQVDIDLSEFVPNDTMQAWVDGNGTLDDLANESFRIAGISEVLFNGWTYYMMMIPTGDDPENLNIDYLIIIGDSIYESYMLDFYYSFNAPQDNMIQYFAYYLGISDDYPVAE